MDSHATSTGKNEKGTKTNTGEMWMEIIKNQCFSGWTSGGDRVLQRENGKIVKISSQSAGMSIREIINEYGSMENAIKFLPKESQNDVRRVIHHHFVILQTCHEKREGKVHNDGGVWIAWQVIISMEKREQIVCVFTYM